MLTVLAVLIGVAIVLLGLLAIVRKRFWPVALIVLILLGVGVMRAEGSQANCLVWLDNLPEGLKVPSADASVGSVGQHARRASAGGVRAGPSPLDAVLPPKGFGRD